VLSRAACEFKGDGSVAALIGVILDVTEEHEQQALLAERTALLEATLDNVEQGIMLVDPEHRIAVANRRTAELLDLPMELLSSRPLGRVLS
jgi:PAS domain-containing protein